MILHAFTFDQAPDICSMRTCSSNFNRRVGHHPSAFHCSQVVGALLDAEASDEFVNNLILSVRSLIPVEQLCAEVEKRNRWASKVAGCCVNAQRGMIKVTPAQHCACCKFASKR